MSDTPTATGARTSDHANVSEAIRPVPQDCLSARRLIVAASVASVFAVSLALHPQLFLGVVLVAVICIPVERLFALHAQRTFRTGWRTDLVHFVANNAITATLLALGVLMVGTLLSTAIPGVVRSTIAAQPLAL